MTTKRKIKTWIDEAPKRTTHMIVVCDTFSHDDYPVYVKRGMSVSDAVAARNGVNMQRVMEVYSMARDIASQLVEVRAYHLD